LLCLGLRFAVFVASGGTAAGVGGVDGEGEVFIVQGGGHLNGSYGGECGCDCVVSVEKRIPVWRRRGEYMK